MTQGTRVCTRDGLSGTVVDVRTFRGMDAPVYAVRTDKGYIKVLRDEEIERLERVDTQSPNRTKPTKVMRYG